MWHVMIKREAMYLQPSQIVTFFFICTRKYCQSTNWACGVGGMSEANIPSAHRKNSYYCSYCQDMLTYQWKTKLFAFSQDIAREELKKMKSLEIWNQMRKWYFAMASVQWFWCNGFVAIQSILEIISLSWRTFKPMKMQY